ARALRRFLFAFRVPPVPRSTLFPYTTLFRSGVRDVRRHVALAGPVFERPERARHRTPRGEQPCRVERIEPRGGARPGALDHHVRSEEHTSELQSPCNLVCRLLLEKKKDPPRRTRRLSTDRRHAASPSPTTTPSSRTLLIHPSTRTTKYHHRAHTQPRNTYTTLPTL